MRTKPPADTPDPVLTIRLQPSTLHVTRWLHLRIWEAFDDNGTIGSRETERWVEELVGTGCARRIPRCRCIDEGSPAARFSRFHWTEPAAFSICPAAASRVLTWRNRLLPSFQESEACVSNPCRMFDQLFNPTHAPARTNETARAFLRTASTAELQAEAGIAWGRAQENKPPRTRAKPLAPVALMFNETSLTPYTIRRKTLLFARLLHERRSLTHAAYIGFLLSLVRQTVFHLTAYDLIAFHHQGANYPDALLLDALLRDAAACPGSAGVV